jgi:CBS domain-containing protein
MIRVRSRRDTTGAPRRDDFKEDGMTVARILANKGPDVVTSQPHRTMAEIAETLASKGIGAIVITDAQGGVLGIVSERDVVRVIARNGVGAMGEAVSRFMTPKVIVTTEDQTVQSMMERMTEGRFRHMPVIRDGRLCGLVSIGDVVKYRLAEMEHEQEQMRNYIASA